MNFRQRSFNFCPERQFGFLPVVATLFAAVGAGTAIASAAGAFNSKASTINPNPTPTAAQTVDPTLNPTGSTAAAGRAALIYTSPQGVQGTDPSNRYALLGNSPGLGNT